MRRLKELISVSSGVTIMRSGNVSCSVLSVKSINENGIDYSAIDNAFATTKTKSLQIDDVLVVNRGKFSVALVEDNLPEGAITTPSFVFTLRINNKDKLLPEYLYYYLNTAKAQRKMKSLQQGGAIAFISKKDLFDMYIEFPPIKQQKIIAKLYKKILELQRIKDKQVELLTKYTDNLLTGAKNG